MRMITTADYRADQEESFAHNIGCGAAYSSLDPRFANERCRLLHVGSFDVLEEFRSVESALL
jgi:hypothetical protein